MQFWLSTPASLYWTPLGPFAHIAQSAGEHCGMLAASLAGTRSGKCPPRPSGTGAAMLEGPVDEEPQAPAELTIGSIDGKPRAGSTDTGLRTHLGRATSVMVGLTMLANIINYGSSLVFSRLLSPASYGDLAALLAFTTVVAVPTAAAQTIVAQRIAVMVAEGAHDRARYLIRHVLAHVSAIAVIVAAVYAACVPLVASALHLETVGPAIALVPLLLASFLLPVAYGLLQGLERFTALGAMMLMIAALRLAIGVPWTVAGGGAGGPLLGQALGSLVVLCTCAYLLRDHLLGRGTGAARAGLRRRPDRRALTAGGVFVGFALLSNLDLLLAKLLLPGRSAGEYAALATIEKIVLFLPAAVAVVMVPRAAKARHIEGSASHVLRASSFLVALTTLLVAAPAALAPHRVLGLMFGPHYARAAAGVLPIVCAGAALALLYLVVTYTVAIEDHRSLWLLLIALALQATSIGIWHASPVEIATVQACAVVLTLIANECLLHPLTRTERLIVSVARWRATVTRSR